MSGHNKWSQLKHQKGATDKKRGVLFSKLLAAITAAAKTEQDPNFNPRLRTAIEKAKENLVPAENIERAVKRAAESGEGIKELIIEAYGPGGIAILIEATTDNRNRTIAEVKHVITEHNGKWAESGSVRWAFNPPAAQGGVGDATEWQPKFPQDISDIDRTALASLVTAIEDHGDIQRIFTNAR